MFKIKRKIGNSQVGADGNVRLGRMVDMMQDCCGFQLDNCQATQDFYRTCCGTTFLTYRHIEIFDDIKYGDEIEIGTRVFQIKATQGRRNTLIFNSEGKVLVATEAGGATINMETGKPAPMGKEYLERYDLGQKYEGMEYFSRKVPLPKDMEPERLEPVKVMRSYIDDNGHMNNARYFDVAEEFLPEDFRFKRVRIAYKLPAKKGEMIFPVRYAMADGRIIISLQNKEGEPFVNIEYTKK